MKRLLPAIGILLLSCWIVGAVLMVSSEEKTSPLPPYQYASTYYGCINVPETEVVAAVAIIPYEMTEGEEPAVENLIPSRSVAALDYTRKDVLLLAKLIHGEAEGEPMDGKLAVGTVVMNRMSVWHKTMSQVIYQKGQFDCLQDHWEPADKESLKAAERVLKGYRAFEGDILYFFNPVTSTDLEFCSSVDVIYVIGGHVFAREFK